MHVRQKPIIGNQQIICASSQFTWALVRAIEKMWTTHFELKETVHRFVGVPIEARHRNDGSHRRATGPRCVAGTTTYPDSEIGNQFFDDFETLFLEWNWAILDWKMALPNEMRKLTDCNAYSTESNAHVSCENSLRGKNAFKTSWDAKMHSKRLEGNNMSPKLPKG